MSKEAEEFFRKKTIENAKTPRMKKFLALVNIEAEGIIMQEYADQQLRLYQHPVEGVNQTMQVSNEQCNIKRVICCGVLEKMNLEWMVLDDGTKCMPFIYGKDQIMYRVNNCPSCGVNVRSATI